MLRKLCFVLLLAAGCRTPLPPPHQPLATAPLDAARAQPPALSPPQVHTPQVGTATRADGLSVWWVERSDAPTTVFVWASQACSLLFAHAPGMPEVAVGAQEVRLEAERGRARGWVGQSGGTLTLEVPSAEASIAAKRFATILSTSPDSSALRASQRILRNELRQQSYAQPSVARRVARAGLFGDKHTLGLLPDALASRAARISVGDVQDYWQTRARAGPRVIIIVGPKAQGLAEHVLAHNAPSLGPAPANVKPWAPLMDADTLRIRVLPRAMTPWVEMTYPVPASAPGDLTPELAAQVIGGSLTGRLGEALRLNSGHSYSLQSSYAPYGGHGELSLRGNVGEGDVPLFVERAGQVVASLAQQPITAAELEVARGRWRGRLAADLTTRMGTAVRLSQSFLVRGEVPNYVREYQALSALDPAALQAWASSAIQARRGQAVVFAREQAILPLTSLGDAAQLDLEPF